MCTIAVDGFLRISSTTTEVNFGLGPDNRRLVEKQNDDEPGVCRRIEFSRVPYNMAVLDKGQVPSAPVAIFLPFLYISFLRSDVLSTPLALTHLTCHSFALSPTALSFLCISIEPILLHQHEVLHCCFVCGGCARRLGFVCARSERCSNRPHS